MAEPIDDPGYWKGRLLKAREAGEIHHTVFKCPLERWQQIGTAHRKILAAHIGPADCILDAGCGYGRLLDMLPHGWLGRYYGVDLSPDLIEEAQRRYGGFDALGFPRYHFQVGDLRDLSEFRYCGIQWAVLISIRPMIRRNLGDAEWEKMHAQLRRVAAKILYLEYDPEDAGEVEVVG